MKKWFEEKILSSNKNTLLFLTISVFSVLFIYQIVLLFYGSYFNANSDDVVQYSSILVQYINYIKEGNLGWYNFSNSFGASIFADFYYLPLDIFTLITFLLSYIVNGTLAFSIANLSKVLLGTVLFAYFLQRKGYKNWIVLIACVVYFSASGIWTFSTYPTYFSLFFYLPLCLIVVDCYSKGKKWILPLYCLVLIFYNFYNAYTLFIFMLLVYIVGKIKDDYQGFKDLFIKAIVFGLHIILGVIMGLCILLPSALYILNYSARTGVSEFEFVFDFEIYFRMLYKMFVYEKSTVAFAFGKTGYIKQHFSLYIGYLGSVCLGLMFLMKDRTSKIYKWTLVSIIGLMIFPIFSMIFSGVAVAYTRWFSFLNIILICFACHVINQIKFKEIDRKKINKVGLFIISLYVLTLIFNIMIINKYKDSDYGLYYNYVQLMINLILFGISIILYVIFYLVKKYDLVYSVFAFEMIIAIVLNFSIAFDSKRFKYIGMYDQINSEFEKLDIGDNEISRVYVSGVLGELYNTNRLMNNLTNETTFHSFINKYFYDYQNIYSDEIGGLYMFDLNRFNPNNSRIMDYKYYFIDKDSIDYELDYLDVYYETEEYVVYVNNNYSPFYVYESYYDEEDATSYNDNKDLAELERNLFKGVILEEGEYNLDKLNYEYSDNSLKLNFVENANMVKVSDNIYEIDFENYSKFGYTGSIYLKSEESDKIIEINVISNEEEHKCKNTSGIYACSLDENSDKVIIKTSDDISKILYSVGVNIDDKEYSLLLIENGNYSKYLNFYSKDMKNLILKNGLENERLCLNGLCKIDDFAFDHILYDDGCNKIKEEEEYSLYYYFDNLEYYDANKVDILASNKSLTYNNSTIYINYMRVSTSDNDQVIVLPITYSEEWQIEESQDYELVRVNGGFLGVIVKNGVNNINLKITFKPSGVKFGLIGSLVGFVIYGGYIVIVYYKKKKEKNDETI